MRNLDDELDISGQMYVIFHDHLADIRPRFPFHFLDLRGGYLPDFYDLHDVDDVCRPGGISVTRFLRTKYHSGKCRTYVDDQL